MQVVEHEQQRAQLSEQAPDRAVHAVALVAAGRVAADRRQHPGEIAVLDRLRGGIRVERVDPDAVGPVALELGPGAGEHDVAVRLRAGTQLGQQPRLADPRFALDRDTVTGQQRRLELGELRGAADDRIQGTGQGVPLMFLEGRAGRLLACHPTSRTSGAGRPSVSSP